VKRAGYSRGLAAHYFGSKQTLVADIATHIVADYSRRLRVGSRVRAGIDAITRELVDSLRRSLSDG
jgi:AcrR family transcriptional regulator